MKNHDKEIERIKKLHAKLLDVKRRVIDCQARDDLRDVPVADWPRDVRLILAQEKELSEMVGDLTTKLARKIANELAAELKMQPFQVRDCFSRV